MITVVMVAVENATFNFDRLYSYKVPETMSQYAVTGARVLVPFGKSAPRMGVILEYDDNPEGQLKDIIDIERDDPVLSPELVGIVKMLHEQTFCTYGDAVRTVLPKSARLVAGSASISGAFEGHIRRIYNSLDLPPVVKLTEKQRRVYEYIKSNPSTAPEICEACKVSRGVIEALENKSLIKRSESVKNYSFTERNIEEIPDLSPAQADAYDNLCSVISDSSKPLTTLLYGVTSSGKTLVYIHLIQKFISEGKGVIILVPEITLAIQTIERLIAVFGRHVGIIHSNLSDSERGAQWERIRSGEFSVVIGTRSAIFAPVQNLGLIIIDEEQEGSYISEQSPRYDARDVAHFRSRKLKISVLLASATPSVVTFHYAVTGRYNLVKLTERFNSMPLPEVNVIDMRMEMLAGNSHYISLPMAQEINSRVCKGEQCILLLNRRGYRTLSMCSSCRAIVKCKSCDTPLVIHRESGNYVCHYCGRTYPLNDTCEVCGGKIKHTGIGTQKMEEEIETLLPDLKIIRLDLDSTSRKNSAANIINEFSEGKYDVMIGTQMIAKGLDFTNVTLVGVLSIDQFLLMPSYKATERTFSMITQVIGRSGRGSKTGSALIQTTDPDNPVIKLAANQDYESFYKQEIKSRKLHLYPPFCKMCAVCFLSEMEKYAFEAAERFSYLLSDISRKSPDIPMKILGPAPMRVAYVNKIFRYRLVLKSRGDQHFRNMLRQVVDIWNNEFRNKKNIRMFVDLTGDTDC